MSNKYIISLLFIQTTVSLFAQDNYFCYYNPNSPSCSSPVLTTFKNVDPEDLFLKNRNYALNIIDTPRLKDNYIFRQKRVKTEDNTNIIAGSDQEELNQDFYLTSEEEILYNKSILPGLSKEDDDDTIVSISTNIFTNAKTKMLLFIFSIKPNSFITYQSSITYLDSVYWSDQGWGDFDVGVNFQILESQWGSIDTSLRLLIPLNEEASGFSNGVYMGSIKTNYIKNIDIFSSKISFSYTKEIQLNLDDYVIKSSSEDATVKNGASDLFVLSYDYRLKDHTHFNFKYLISNIDSTYINNISKHDGAIYQDSSADISTNLYKLFDSKWDYLKNLYSTLGFIYPLATQYKDTDLSYNKRETSYYFSLQKLF
jgi:hypothetical protein